MHRTPSLFLRAHLAGEFFTKFQKRLPHLRLVNCGAAFSFRKKFPQRYALAGSGVVAQKPPHKTHSQGQWMGAGETGETRNTGKTRNTGETRKVGNPIPPISPVLPILPVSPVLPATLVTLVTPATPATPAPLSVWALGAVLTRKRSPRFALYNQGLRLSNCGA